MGKKKASERSMRRAQARATRKLVQAKEKLAALSPGGAEHRPIEVVASSVIEIRARSIPCPLCEGELDLLAHRSADVRLRALEVRCRQCGVTRTLWFKIVGPSIN